MGKDANLRVTLGGKDGGELMCMVLVLHNPAVFQEFSRLHGAAIGKALSVLDFKTTLNRQVASRPISLYSTQCVKIKSILNLLFSRERHVKI